MCLFGVGDGGGGPKEEHIEFGLRMANLEGSPKVKFGRADDFFQRLNKYKDKLATWVGELYLERHRGTYTSQALVKKANRQLELKLREVEMLYTCLPLEHYPLEKLDAIWKKVLINQFHDIIPGSSIKETYKVTHREHQQALSDCDQLAGKAAELLFIKDDTKVVLFNSLSYPFQGVYHLPEGWKGASVLETGKVLPVQKEQNEYVVEIEILPLTCSTLIKSKDTKDFVRITQNLVLENDLVRYEFSTDGALLNAYDKECQREILAQNRNGNVISIYEDHPNEWDAWDIDIFYENQLLEIAQSQESTKIVQGPLRQGLKFVYRFNKSCMEQEIYLSARSKRLDFNSKVEWLEKHRMLRVAFPVNVFSDQASFDIQYGFVKRNTHRNTSWDSAKFEVAAQRYADLSEADYGVALLNNCKYGYKVYDNVLDLNLLRAPTYPDPDADQGKHEFIYSLLPHSGDLIHSDVLAEAAQLNQGILEFRGFCADGDIFPCRLEGDGLSVEAIKKSEKNEYIIIRIVETKGKRSSGQLKFPKKPLKLIETDLLEWSSKREIICEDYLNITLKPFEIRTYKLKFN